MGHLGVEELLGDHANDLTTGRQYSIGQHPHQPHAATAVHETDLPIGERMTEVPGGLDIRRATAHVRTAVDTEPGARRGGVHQISLSHPRSQRMGRRSHVQEMQRTFPHGTTPLTSLAPMSATMPTPDLVTAADVIEMAAGLVRSGVRQLAANGGPDTQQVLAYDLAHEIGRAHV